MEIEIAISNLSFEMDKFFEEVLNKKARAKATDEWIVQEVLAHLTFWHMNYTANYQARVKKSKPLLKCAGYKINQEGVASLKCYSRDKLIRISERVS